MTDHYFVSAQDAGRTIPLLGPFTDEDLCKKYAYGDESRDMIGTCYKIDPKSHFYSFGMFKVPMVEMCPFNYKGVLNKIDPEKWDKVIQ